jgi:hypothetical protein
VGPSSDPNGTLCKAAAWTLKADSEKGRFPRKIGVHSLPIIRRPRNRESDLRLKSTISGYYIGSPRNFPASHSADSNRATPMLGTREFASSSFTSVQRRNESGNHPETDMRKRTIKDPQLADGDERDVRQCIERVEKCSEHEGCFSPARCFPLRPNYSDLDNPLAPMRRPYIVRPNRSLIAELAGMESRESGVASFLDATALLLSRDEPSHLTII